MQLHAGKARVPHVNPDTLRRGLGKEARYRVSTQRCLEGEIQVLRNGLPQKPDALPPRRTVGFS
jgi:hypothetical protein